MNKCMEEKELKKIIRKKLKEKGIPTHLSGYRYLVEALYYAVSYEQDSKAKMLKIGEIYNYAALKKKSTYSKVERAIRVAVSHIDNMKLVKMRSASFIYGTLFEILEELG